ncbi:hypothetical protein HPP92_010878 [Vanilla planifolia]|uniref:Transcriptional factor DELLA N-terminal domain-containing protein n=1 Tax=Vanilla planifolia TaxID=51239 RepID=A0A835QV60_VANPL|nr:hypothetical protein HPP92_011149 [Vanilla planifolia]KAG0482794.1 hypothetical protein HPP92_010878 [Vanilla planifolia]
MKRELEHPESFGESSFGGHTLGSVGIAAPIKGKMLGFEEPDSGMDELLAALGYKVRSSDMADVAQKLEQLEMAIEATRLRTMRCFLIFLRIPFTTTLPICRTGSRTCFRSSACPRRNQTASAFCRRRYQLILLLPFSVPLILSPPPIPLP